MVKKSVQNSNRTFLLNHCLLNFCVLHARDLGKLLLSTGNWELGTDSSRKMHSGQNRRMKIRLIRLILRRATIFFLH